MKIKKHMIVLTAWDSLSELERIQYVKANKFYNVKLAKNHYNSSNEDEEIKLLKFLDPPLIPSKEQEQKMFNVGWKACEDYFKKLRENKKDI